METQTLQDLIASIERAAKAARITVDEVCTEIGIHRATWQRWKRKGGDPRASQLELMQAMPAKFERIAQARHAAAGKAAE